MRVAVSCAALLCLSSASAFAAAPATTSAVTPAYAQPGCGAFTWNLAREFAALQSPPVLVNASADPEVNPVRIKEDQHVTATLLPQGSIKFATPPRQAAKAASPTGGLLFFKSGSAGKYRFSLTSQHWIDVLVGRSAIVSSGYQAAAGCKLAAKVVEFELPANRDLVIQLSGADAATLGLVITAAAKE